MSETIRKTNRFHFHPRIILSVKHEIMKVFQSHALNLEPGIINEMINKLDWASACTANDEDIKGLEAIEEYKLKEDWKNDDCDLCYPCFTSVIENRMEDKFEKEKEERKKIRKERRKNERDAERERWK